MPRWSSALPRFGDEYDGGKLRELVRILESVLATSTRDEDLVAVDDSDSPYGVPRHVRTVLGDTTGGALAVRLPDATDKENYRRRITVVRTSGGANNLTVDTVNGQTINGAASKVLGAQWARVTVVSNGANWIIVHE